MNEIQLQDADQAIVQTPFGRGIILRTRNDDNIKEVQLLEWEGMAKPTSRDNKPIIMYTSINYPSVQPHIGDDVVCSYGRGRVEEVLSLPTTTKNRKLPRLKYSIALSSWRLRGRAKVSCSIISPPPRVVRKHTLSEMDAYEKVELAQSQKMKATEYFVKKKDYSLALNSYAGALDAVRNVQHDYSSTNEVRSDLVLTMITCSNNAATCCVKLTKWEEAKKFAQNSLILCDALLAKRGLKIHTILNKEGTIDAKLFGEFRVKNYLVIAMYCLQSNDYEGAIAILKKAKAVAMEYIDNLKSKQQCSAVESASLRGLLSQIKEVRRIMTECTEKKKEAKNMEKKRAQAMFSLKNNIHDPPQSTKNDDTSINKNASSNDAINVHNEQTTVTKQTEEPSTPPSLKSSFNDKSPRSLRKSVSFSQKPPQIKEFDSPISEKYVPWYSEHKEALMLLTMAGLTVFAFVNIRKRS